jgi:hypothetical protein
MVFKFGDVGENFYLILNGEVEIFVPNPSKTGLFNELRRKISL